MNSFYCDNDNHDSEIKSLIYFNNQGMQHFENGNFDKAKAFLRSAVIELNNLRETYEPIISQDEPVCGDQFCVENGSPIQGWSMPFQRPERDDCAITFTRAMLLSDNESFSYFDDQACLFHLNVATVVLLYNTSLLNHVFSDANGQISTVVNEAYHGYEEAFVISRNMKETSSTFAFHLTVLTLALFNNMGVLYYNNMCRFADAAQCFRASRKKLNMLGEKNATSQILTIKEVHNLSTNLLMVPRATTCAA